MNSIKFLSILLKTLKFAFPELYKIRIRGRWSQLIDEYAPKDDEAVGCRHLTFLKRDLQFLWAITMLLKEHVNGRPISNGSSLNRALSNIELAAAYALIGQCGIVFWELVKRQLPKINRTLGYALCLNKDWSIGLKDPPEEDGRKMRDTSITMACDVIVAQGYIIEVADYYRR